MNALAPKYAAEAMPITMPMRIAWPCRQSGHQCDVTVPPATRAGAAAPIATALSKTRTDQLASAHRQSPWARGRTPTGVVSAVGSVSPIRMPLL